jgi:hypothetical protein
MGRGHQRHLARGLLNEALGLDPPVVAAPCVKEALQRHPVYAKNAKLLAAAGAAVLDTAQILTQSESGATTMNWPLVLPACCIGRPRR